jgi:hypothetical protein
MSLERVGPLGALIMKFFCNFSPVQQAINWADATNLGIVALRETSVERFSCSSYSERCRHRMVLTGQGLSLSVLGHLE